MSHHSFRSFLSTAFQYLTQLPSLPAKLKDFVPFDSRSIDLEEIKSSRYVSNRLYTVSMFNRYTFFAIELGLRASETAPSQ